MTTNILFILLAGTMLLGIWPGNAAVFFALYLLLMGAAAFATGYDAKMTMFVWHGLYSIVFGLVYVTWFATAPFLAAAIILGIPPLVGSFQMKK